MLQLPKRWVFRDCLKESKESPGRRSPGGRSFHSWGPAAEKLLSPSLLCVRSTSSFRISLEWDLSGRRPASDRRWQSSARYAGAAPTSDWFTSPAILNTTRCRTGSQCSCRNTGVMWSLRRAPVTRRAAAFCTDWRRWSSPCWNSSYWHCVGLGQLTDLFVTC